MKKILASVLVISAALVLFLLIGVGAASEYQKGIYGDDDKIVKGGDSKTYMMHLDLFSRNQNSDTKFTGFTGSDTVFVFSMEAGETIEVSYDVAVSAGQFKVVLIDPDNVISVITEGSGDGEMILTVAKAGTYRIKYVGLDASGSADVTYRVG